MAPIPAPFAALQTAINGLDAFFKLQTFDLTPVILTQPPLNRDARPRTMEATLETLDPQLTMIQEMYARLGTAHNVILRLPSMAYSALRPVSAIPCEVLQIVFSYLHDAEEGDATTALTMSHVYAFWREVVRGHERIWSFATITGTHDLHKLALPLSLSGQGDFHLAVAPRRPKTDEPSGMLPLQRTLRSRLSMLQRTSSEYPDRFLSCLRDRRPPTQPSIPTANDYRARLRLTMVGPGTCCQFQRH